MNFSTSSRYVLVLTIVCILLVISTACTDIVPLPTKAPTRTPPLVLPPTSTPPLVLPPTSTPEGGLAASTVGQVGSRESAGSLQHNRVELTPNRQEPPGSEWVEQAIRYVAETYGIAEDVLRLTNEEGLHLPTLDKTILTITFTAMQQPDYPVYRVLIDIDTGEISEDLQALRQAEEEARMQKYDKLETGLFDMLQEADDDEIFPVAIWAAEYDKSLSPSELYDILAARYPQAAQAMAEGRKPWRVEDGELSKEIRTAYFAELDKNAKTRVAPILAMLKSYEESVEHQWGEPRIVAEIPKKMILKLDRHPAVARIFYYSNEVVPE